MVQPKKVFIAYLKDGTEIRFTHAVDYRDGLRAGMTMHPPGVVATEEPAKPEGEKVSGISPIVSEKAEPQVAEHAEEGNGTRKKLKR